MGLTSRDIENNTREMVNAQNEESAIRRRDYDNNMRGDGKAGPSVKLGLTGERTAFAEWVLRVGWVALAVGVLLRIMNNSTLMDGKPLSQVLIILGVACLGMVYLFQLFAILYTIAAMLLFYNAGSTPQGFSLGAVPIQAYLVSGGIIFVIFLMKRLLVRN